MLNIKARQGQLLNFIVKEYIDTAVPIGSSVLVSKCGLDISSATVRNEMAALEKQGYIYQPHTSAGRVPTEKGYKFFVKNMSEEDGSDDLAKSAVELLEQALRYAESHEARLKNLAKAVAEISGETILIGFSAHDLYYTGVSNLFRKPEFSARGGSAFGGKNQNIAVNIAEIIDEFDEAMEQVFSLGEDEPKVLIGADNPFSSECSAILTNIRTGETNSVFGLLGPMRMDYENNLAMMKHIKKLLNSIF